jgi:putative transposase
LVAENKCESSKWAKVKGRKLNKFAWQNGYGAFSIGQTEVERLRAYIARQPAHHQRKSFKD